MRLIIAAILGGLVMFTWSAFSHMALGLFNNSVKPVPNEPIVVSAMKANITEPGLYYIPGMDMSKTPTDEETAAFAAKYKEGPTAFLVYHPAGADIMTPTQLATEFGSNVLSTFALALILSLAAISYSRGVIVSTLVGLAGWLSINASYWNWYRFPTDFVAAELIDQVAGWFLVGLVMAFVLRRRS